MVRILNIVQGLLSLSVVFVFAHGGPVWQAMIGLIAPIAIGLIIVMVLREESPKGKIREAIELLFGIILGIGGLLYWAFESPVVNLESTTPWWLMVAAWPSVIFNLGLLFAILTRLGSIGLHYLTIIFEFVSGEEVPF